MNHLEDIDEGLEMFEAERQREMDEQTIQANPEAFFHAFKVAPPPHYYVQRVILHAPRKPLGLNPWDYDSGCVQVCVRAAPERLMTVRWDAGSTHISVVDVGVGL